MKDDAERARECLARVVSQSGPEPRDSKADEEWCAWLLAKNTRLDREKLDGSTALRAMIAFAQQPEGWRLVPIVPDEAMMQAGVNNNPTSWTGDTDIGFAHDVAATVWSAMLGAASIPGEE